MSARTGGYAFPCQHRDGMTLRDYFAAQALVGIAGSRETMARLLEQGAEVGVSAATGAAILAYQFADALLRERDK